MMSLRSVVYAALVLLTFGSFSAVLPRFREIYADLLRPRDLSELPGSTRLVLHVPAVSWAILAIVAAIALLWKDRIISRHASDMINVVTLVIFLGIVGYVVVALFRPMMGPFVYVGDVPPR